MVHTLTLQISSDMAEAISLVAKAEDATPSEVIRDAIRRDLRRQATLIRQRSQQRRAFDPIRNLLLTDFERAQNWDHLQSRLLDKGYRLFQRGGDLVIHRASGEQICRLSDIGQNQTALARRFQAPFGRPKLPKTAVRAIAS